MIKGVLFALLATIVIVLMVMQLALFVWIVGTIRRQQSKAASRRNVGLTLFVVGVAFALVGLGFGAWTVYFKARGDRAVGRVIALERHEDKDGEMFAPVFAFTNASGERFEVKATVRANPPDHQVGDVIPVLYMAHDPQTARPDTFAANWLVPAIFGGVGGALAIAGACVLVFRAG